MQQLKVECLVCSRTSKEINGVGGEWSKKRVGDEGREVTGDEIMEVLESVVRSLAFTLYEVGATGG